VTDSVKRPQRAAPRASTGPLCYFQPSDAMISLLSLLAILLYLTTGFLLGLRLAGAGGGALVAKPAALTLGMGAVMLHAAILYQGIVTAQGLNVAFFTASSLVGWLVALLLLVAAMSRPVENLGIILLPFAALTLALQSAFPTERIILEPANWQLEAHILISILAYSMLTIATVQAVLLAIQDRNLRRKRPGGFIRALPPLQTMETLLFQMIGVGFVLLSLALLSGIIFLEDIFAQHLVHKTVLSILAWALFAVLLWGRHQFGWRGRIAIRWTAGGFAALMLAYFGTKLVLELVLGR
jgi:ABC-type uncharacterized transport system permease subunit